MFVQFIAALVSLSQCPNNQMLELVLKEFNQIREHNQMLAKFSIEGVLLALEREHSQVSEGPMEWTVEEEAHFNRRLQMIQKLDHLAVV